MVLMLRVIKTFHGEFCDIDSLPTSFFFQIEMVQIAQISQKAAAEVVQSKQRPLLCYFSVTHPALTAWSV